jgi:hypothetical protein
VSSGLLTAAKDYHKTISISYPFFAKGFRIGGAIISKIDSF